MDLQLETNTEASSVATQAYIAAEHIASFNPAAMLLVAVSAGVVIAAAAMGTPTFRLLGIIPAIASIRIFFVVARWSRMYGSYQFEDADFIAARRTVRRSLWLWRAAIVTQILGVFVPV